MSVLLAAAIIVVLGFVPVANLLNGAPYIPWWSAAVHEWALTGSLILLLAWLLARLLGERLDRIEPALTAIVLAPSPRAFAAACAGFAFLLTNAFAVYCFARAPYGQDEMAQRFQAHLLLHGRLFAFSGAPPEFFSAAGILDAGGRLTSQYPIGGPALLALGMAARAVWLVNPLLTALIVRNVYRFAAVAYGEPVARAGVLLFVVSPFVLTMGASEMNHVGALALGSLALAALPTWTTAIMRGEGPAWRSAMLIGLGVGGMAAIRPLDALVLGVVIGAFQLAVLVRAPRGGRWSSLLLQVLGGALPVAGLLIANARTTGHALQFAYSALYGPNESIGFHLDPLGRPHTAAHGLLLASANLMRLNRFLFEWPLPGLLPVVATLVTLRRPTRWDLLLVGLVVVLLAGYALYWFDGFFAGPRFMFSAVPALVLLAARAPGLLAQRAAGVIRRAVVLVVPLCTLWAWVSPAGVSSVRLNAYFYHEARKVLKSAVAPVVQAARLENALVFVHEGWRARLDARLRALGLTPGESEHILSSSDACQVELALDAEEARTARDTSGRAARLWTATRPATPLHPLAGLNADESVLVAEGATLAPACLTEIQADTIGVAPFTPFLELEGLEPNGSLGGPAVFARDFGPHNEVLRARFPARRWYRYKAPRFPGDPTAALVPY